jgi:hypothetical protein
MLEDRAAVLIFGTLQDQRSRQLKPFLVEGASLMAVFALFVDAARPGTTGRDMTAKRSKKGKKEKAGEEQEGVQARMFVFE